jgi:SnoaL-like protein
VSRYVPLLIAGDLKGLLDLFGDAPRVNDPRLGWVEGQAFELFVAASHEGLTARQARVEHLATTFNATGAVEECILTLVRADGTVHLPVAVAAGLSADVLDSVRIYHSLWPLMGAHAVRPAIFPSVPGLVVPDVVRRYHDRLAAGDVAGVLQQFEAGAVASKPNGEPYIHRGMAALRQFFGRLLATGGIALEHCALTDDGTSCALEYNVAAWGGISLPRQPGIAVYERSLTGLLASARIYDDVQAPLLGAA